MTALSVLTASHDNAAGLVALHRQIEPSLGSDIEWIVKDSGACASTAAWSESVQGPSLQVLRGPDAGIYDALNQALQAAIGRFYLVVGSDDALLAASLGNLVRMINGGDLDNTDVASFPVRVDGQVHTRTRLRPLFASVSGIVSSHSVGTVIRRSLHDTLGPYDRRYRILADALFLRRAVQAKARVRSFDGPILGEFSTTGVSSRAHSQRILEAYSYNVECGDPPWVQALLLCARAVRYHIRSFL